MKSMLLALAVLALGACAAPRTEMTDAGKNVQTGKADPPAGCEEIGFVSGERANMYRTPAQNQEDAQMLLRNNAAEKGATYVRIDTFVTFADGLGGRYSGTAFKCPGPAK